MGHHTVAAPRRPAAAGGVRGGLRAASPYPNSVDVIAALQQFITHHGTEHSAAIRAGLERLRKRGHNVAVTELARKLIVLIWYLLRNQLPYRYAAPQTTQRKLRAVTPGRKAARRDSTPISLDTVYDEAHLPPLEPASAAERRAAARNRRAMARLQKANPTKDSPQLAHS